MSKKLLMTALFALSLFSVLATTSAEARRGDDVPAPPECQVEDGGVLVCK